MSPSCCIPRKCCNSSSIYSPHHEKGYNSHQFSQPAPFISWRIHLEQILCATSVSIKNLPFKKKLWRILNIHYFLFHLICTQFSSYLYLPFISHHICHFLSPIFFLPISPFFPPNSPQKCTFIITLLLFWVE